MRKTKRRLLLSALMTVLAATLGASTGAIVAMALMLRLTQSELQTQAESILEEGDSSSQEGRELLASLRASVYPPCSDAELEWFRHLVLRTQYMRDTGRIREGKIVCSATAGRLAVPMKLPTPDIVQIDGIHVYRRLPPPGESSIRRLTIQQGDAYVVFAGNIMSHWESQSVHFTISVFDAPKNANRLQLGNSLGAREEVLRQQGVFRNGYNLFATACSTRFLHCITTTMPIQEGARRRELPIATLTILGALLGVAFRLLGSFWYRRYRGMEQQLRRAIRQQDLNMVYQPIVELDGDRLVGAEALARWTDERGQSVSPDVFITLAEERHFIGEITAFVVKRTLRDLGVALRTVPGFTLSINVAAADLRDPAFLPFLEEQLRLARVDPSRVAIEITESSTARDDAVIETIRILHARGHSVRIDDFGTGYSSLAYLQHLDVDAIKIDKSFTQSIGTGAVTTGILPLILDLADRLKLQVIVEGIENQEQAEYFIGASTSKPYCVQGWFFGRPLPPDEFVRLLETRQFREESAVVS